MALSEYKAENIKVKLTFGNGEIYEAEQFNRNKNILYSWSKTKSENNTAGNPLGIPQSGKFSCKILDDTDNLVSTNKNSPYFGYMDSGVKVEVFRMVDSEWSPYGVYYTDSWNSNIEYGKGFITSIQADDKLIQLGMMGVPKLPSFTNIDIKEVLVNLLEGCGLEASEYEIDQRLKLDIPYFVNPNNLMRDELKAICQALIAVIVVDDTGKIIIKPAFSVSGEELGNLDTNIMNSLLVRNNTDKIYNAVRVDFTSINLGSSSAIVSLNEQDIPNGSSFIDNITLNNNIIGIDGVSVEYDIDSSELDKIDSIYYQGFQNGLTLSILNSSASLKSEIKVYGRLSNEASAFVYDSKHSEENINNASLLKISNKYIQSKSVAQNYADKILEYLEKLTQKITIKSYVGLDVDCGCTFNIKADDLGITAGTYYIKSVNVSSGTNYSNTIEAIRIG